MPYTSRAQQGWAHTPNGMKALGGSAKVAEWDKASKGMKLPERSKRAFGGVVPGYDIGGAIDPQQQQPGAPPPPGVMPTPQMPGNAPTGGPGVQMGPPQSQGMNPAPPLAPGAMPSQPPGQWASGVAQNAAPPANPQNAPAIPPNAGPAQQPMGKQLMANGGALPRAGGGMNMAKAPNLQTPWQTKSEDRRLHIGPVLSNVPGRTDNHRVKVPSGSYVLPAQHVASIGQGNSLAGMSLAHSMFGGPYGTSAGRIAHGSGAPRPPRMMKGLADGGSPQQDYGQPVDVDISGGEYVVPPEAIIHRYGDLDTGHKILDKWVMDTRKKEIATQKRLPPPAKA